MRIATFMMALVLSLLFITGLAGCSRGGEGEGEGGNMTGNVTTTTSASTTTSSTTTTTTTTTMAADTTTADTGMTTVA